MIKQAAANLEAVGVKKIGAALADAGYWSKATMEAIAESFAESLGYRQGYNAP